MIDNEPYNSAVIAAVDQATRQIDINNLHPLVIETFLDEKLFYSLQDSLVSNSAELAKYIENSSKLRNMLCRERYKRDSEPCLLGEEVDLPESRFSGGAPRSAESGRRINIDYLRQQGVDPAKVLLFRVTQPSQEPKPEYYWTTDYFETKKGLTVEITPKNRATAVTLVADMQTVAGEKGLIQDINDDNGLAVRQIGTEPFDQKQTITIIR